MSLEARSVGFAYPGSDPVLREISTHVTPGEFLALVGANGSGKSTLIRLLSGYLAPRNGGIFLDGVRLSERSPRQIARRLATLEQQPSIALDFRVGDIVAMGRLPHIGSFGRMKAEDRRAVEEAMRLTDTHRLADRPIHTLSGGEQQRAFLAMALAQSPDFLLLDEPTSHLDIRYQMELLEIIRRRVLAGLGVVAALHDLNAAAQVGDRLAVLYAGRLLADGAPVEILSASLVAEAFGVTASVRFDRELGRLLILPIERARRVRSADM